MAIDERPQGFSIIVRKPNGLEEELSAQCERVLLGSGAHCEIRLPVEYSAVEHVELTIANGRVYARARSFEPAPTIGGSPFVQGYVESGVEIGIGPLRIIPSLTMALGPTTGEAARNSSSRIRMAAMGGGVILLLLAVGGGAAQSGLGKRGNGVVPPPLWGAAPAACPQARPVQALAFAEEKRRAAEGKRERRPYHIQDGVAAVPLFEVASVCYAAGGDQAMAAQTAQAAVELRSKVGEDYHAHQMRLEHALGVKDGATIWHEVTALREMTDGLTGPYITWLGDLDRALRAEAK